MQRIETVSRLTMYIGEEQKDGHTPLFEAIVMEARKRGLAGATVTRGILGFGAHSSVRSAQILRLSEDLPIVVQIVDDEARLISLAEDFSEKVDQGLVIIEPVQKMVFR